jgi:hypothetical protein
VEHFVAADLAKATDGKASAQPIQGMESVGAERGGGDGFGSAGSNAQGGGHGGPSHRRNPGALERGTHYGVPGRTQQPFFGDQTKGPRLSILYISNRNALLRSRQIGNTFLLIPIKNVEEADLFAAWQKHAAAQGWDKQRINAIIHAAKEDHEAVRKEAGLEKKTTLLGNFFKIVKTTLQPRHCESNIENPKSKEIDKDFGHSH